MDNNVNPVQTMQLVHALIEADKDFDMLLIPNSWHATSVPHEIRRRWDYFVRHLLGAEPPADYHIAPASG